MIDADGYRANVGIVVINHHNQVLLAKRIGESGWQLPQGGIDKKESEIEALYRELYEEVGLVATDVSLIAKTPKFKYELPRGKSYGTKFVGQNQVWYLLRLITSDTKVNLSTSDNIEFDSWQWVDYWHPIEAVIYFKKAVYEDMLKVLAPVVFNNEYRIPKHLSRPPCAGATAF